MSEPFTAPSSADDVKSYIEDNDIEFLFAQFVDMHGKPNAKLVPARHFDGLMEDGAGFAGFAAGAIGQFPHDPDLAAMPDPRSFIAAVVEARRGAARLRRARGGRGVAATARARSCAASSTARASSATSS